MSRAERVQGFHTQGHENLTTKRTTKGPDARYERVESAARAWAIHNDTDGCFERIDAWEALEDWEREAHPDEYPESDYEDCTNYRDRSTAALSASDALLRTDEAVERGARALFIALHPSGVLGWERQALVTKDKYRDHVRTALDALLGEGE